MEILSFEHDKQELLAACALALRPLAAGGRDEADIARQTAYPSPSDPRVPDAIPAAAWDWAAAGIDPAQAAFSGDLRTTQALEPSAEAISRAIERDALRYDHI